MITPPVAPAFERDNIAAVLVSSDLYAPYTAVTVKSVIDNASSDKNYDIIILSLDMTEAHERALSSMSEGKDNISVRVVCPEDIYNTHIKGRLSVTDNERYGVLLAMRVFFSQIFESYDKIISLDGDMLVCDDIAKLYGYELGDNYAGAVFDYIAACCYYSIDAVKRSVDTAGILYTDYFNTGLVIQNLKDIRKDFTPQQMLDHIIKNKCGFFDKDAFNHFFRGRLLRLDMSWNFPVDPNSYINSGRQYVNSKFYNDYLEAAKCPKIIHFTGDVKPWDIASVTYATKWWNLAVDTPLFGEIMSRREPETNSKKKNKQRYALFICDTVFQLMAALSIKFHLYSDIDADLALTMTTDFSGYIEVLNNTKLFKKIYVSQYCSQRDHKGMLNAAPNRDLMKNPKKYKHSFPLEHPYSDYFMSVCSSTFHKLTYYQIVKLGTTPLVHVFDEGSITYTNNISETCSNDALDHTIYRNNDRLVNNISEILVFEPEFYSGGENRPISSIPKINLTDTKFVELLEKIFGKCEMPKERYIFFNECFAVEKRASNDIQILDRIAEKVGKENIIVKMHPRDLRNGDLYRLHGYKLFEESPVPWEMFVLYADMENKVLISASSNTTINPYIVLNKNTYGIYLWKTMISKRTHVVAPMYKKFIGKVKSAMNAEETRLFCPNTIYELDAVIDYLEGVR